jgi:glycosyltransferase involved in cell wall biosynthesis
MHTATIYVGPSRYEPFGLAPAEAAVSGCALLMSDIGSFRELWGDAAHYFPSGQVAGLAESLAGLLTQPGEVRRLAEAARRHAMHHFSASRFVEGYLGLYAAMAAGRMPGGVSSPSGAERRAP